MKGEAFDEPPDELLFRLVAGLCSTAEQVELERWQLRTLGNASRIDDVRRIWLASGSTHERDVERMWARMRSVVEQDAGRGHEIDSTDQPAAQHVPLPAVMRPPTRSLAAAIWAAGIIAIVGSGAAYFSRSQVPVLRGLPAASHIYATGPAQTARVRLRDGSQVTLAPKSRLSVPDDFGTHERLVSLDGQGLFNVMHDPTRPFRVLAKGAITQDIGTRFDLRAYDDEPGVLVIVANGAVTLGRIGNNGSVREAEGVIVLRGERARLGDADGPITVDRVSLRLLDWTEGRLSFVRTPLAEIARTISRWYDLDVHVGDAALARRPITADFSTTSPREMVEALANAVDAAVEQHGRVVTIRPKP